MKIFQLIFPKKVETKQEDQILIDDPYKEIGNLIKRSRIEQNISIKQLSDISKIPLSTINAIENNIKEIRPRYPFIRSILLKLEECLFLKKYQLTNIAEKEIGETKKKVGKSFVVNKFDFLSSWHGNVIYLLILIISIFILNNYYMRTRIIEFEFIEKNINNSEELPI